MSDNENGSKNLEEMSIGDLRKVASTVYRISITRDMDKEQILRLIGEKKRRGDFAELAEFNGDAPKPGYARIMIHKSSLGYNRPVYISTNGYRITVPRGVEVDVPIKVVGVLNDSRSSRLREDLTKALNDPARWTWEESHDYPFSVVSLTPGPDPKPGNEANRMKSHRLRTKFRDKFGIWPKHEELRQAIRDGELDD